MSEAARDTGMQVPAPKRDIKPAAMTDKASIRKYQSDNAGTKDLPKGSGK